MTKLKKSLKFSEDAVTAPGFVLKASCCTIKGTPHQMGSTGSLAETLKKSFFD